MVAWFRKNSMPILGILTAIVAIWGGLMDKALSFSQEAYDNNLSTLLLLLELDILAETLGESKLPLISGIFKGAAEDLSRAKTFLEFSTATSAIMHFILSAFDLLAIKILWVVVGVLSLWKNFRNWCGKRLLLVFLLFPGLPIYMASFYVISEEIKEDLDWKPHVTISDAHDHYKVQERTDGDGGGGGGGGGGVDATESENDKKREEKTEAKASKKNYHHRHGAIKKTAQKTISAGIRILAENIIMHLLVPFLYLAILRRYIRRMKGADTKETAAT